MVQLGLGEAGVGADALVLQLDVEVALVEAAGELTGPFHGVVEATLVKQLRDDAGDAGRRADDAVAVLLQHGEGGARLVVEVVHVGLADEFQQVVVALVVLRQKQQVVQLRLHVLAQGLVGGEVHLAAKDGLHALARLLLHRVARVGEFHHARHDAVVGDSHRRHVQLGGAAHHVLDMGEPVEQRVFRMVVQMDKCHRQPLRQGRRRTGSFMLWLCALCRVMLGRKHTADASPARRAASLPTALTFRHFLGCHDTSLSPHGVRTNSEFCMECPPRGECGGPKQFFRRKSHDARSSDLRRPFVLEEFGRNCDC